MYNVYCTCIEGMHHKHVYLSTSAVPHGLDTHKHGGLSLMDGSDRLENDYSNSLIETQLGL